MFQEVYWYTSTFATFVSFQTILPFDDSHLGNRSIITEIFCHFDGSLVTIEVANTISFGECNHCKKYQRYQYPGLHVEKVEIRLTVSQMTNCIFILNFVEV